MILIRNHITRRFDRARLALEMRRSVRPTATIAIGALVALAFMAYIVRNVASEIYTPTQTVRFEVDDARAVRGGIQDVTFKGIPAGSIVRSELDDGRPSVTVKVLRKFGTIHRDARAVLKPRTVLQDMSLDIVDPGSRRAGRASERAVVPASQTSTSVNVADVLQTFTPATRERLTRLLDDLGGGLEDRGRDLREAFAQTVPFLQATGDLSRQLTRRARLTRRLVHNASLLTGELAEREHDVRTLIDAGAATLDTTAAAAPDLDRTLRELPATLDEVDRSFTAVRGVLDEVDPALVALGPAAKRLPNGLRSVRSLAGTAAPAVERLREPVRRLRPLASALTPASSRLRASVASLRPQIDDIDHVTRTVAGCTYALDRFFQWTPSVFKLGDARGVAPRAYATTGLGASQFTKDPNVFAPDSCAPGRPIAGTPGPGGSR